jgi:hypothetical protein
VVALVQRRERDGHGDGLVAVGDEHVEPVVEDAHAVVRVAGGQRHLRRGGERRVAQRDGAAQLQVLQVEGRLGGAQREVDDERDEGGDEDKSQQAGGQAPAAAAQAVLVRVVVLPLLLAHDDAAVLCSVSVWCG